MLILWSLLILLVALIPGTQYGLNQIKHAPPTYTLQNPVKVSYYPQFRELLIFLLFDVLKLVMFVFLFQQESILYISLMILGVQVLVYPKVYKRQDSFFFLLAVVLSNIWIGFFVVGGYLFFILRMKDFLPFIFPLISGLFCLFYWVTGADLYYVSLFFIFLLVQLISLIIPKRLGILYK